MDMYLALFQGRERFTDCVRPGKPALDLSGPEAENLWASYTTQFLVRWPWFAEIVRKRWEAAGVAARAVSGAHILDVGSGAGVKSFVLAQADPTIRVTAVDTPKVLAVAARIAGVMGVADIVHQRLVATWRVVEGSLPLQQKGVARCFASETIGPTVPVSLSPGPLTCS